MKRFTETTKWSDPWFRRLSERAKLLWGYLTDNCNAVGLIDLDFDAASFHIGGKVEEKHLTELGDRLQRLQGGKIFIPKFIPFQYGTLSDSCPAHKPVFRLIETHHLIHSELGYQYPISVGIQIPTGQDRNGQDQEKDQEEGVQGEMNGHYHKDSRTALHWLNEKSGKHFRETDTNLSFISQRLSEPEVTIDGVKQMIDRQCLRWKGKTEAEYLRPETLFNKTKFDGYYAAKEQPVIYDTYQSNSGVRNQPIKPVAGSTPNNGF
jgi:uncharacterized phage protein (TIGR02220 family)